jgi:hypothetical protein
VSINDGSLVTINFEDSDQFDPVRLEGNAGLVEEVVQSEVGDLRVT